VNFGNAVVAQRDSANGRLRGPAVDIAGELARRLSVPLSIVGFDAATPPSRRG
jgi:polar amino acid transport system substrate-binding protein